MQSQWLDIKIESTCSAENTDTQQKVLSSTLRHSSVFFKNVKNITLNEYMDYKIYLFQNVKNGKKFFFRIQKTYYQFNAWHCAKMIWGYKKHNIYLSR